MNQIKETTLDWAAIIEDGNKPRSIREIKEKYQLSFPFSVRRVVTPIDPESPGKVGDIVPVTGFSLANPGTSQEFWGLPELEEGPQGLWTENIDIPVFVLWD